MFNEPRTRAFTLVEILVAVAIIAVLIAIAIPAFGAVRHAAWAASCGSNLHQLGVAFGAQQVKPNEPLPYFVVGLPASPPVERTSVRAVFPQETYGDILYCPADRRDRTSLDSSYQYDPGVRMYWQASIGVPNPAEAVTRWYSQFTNYSVFSDEQPWHNGKHNVLFAPDWHVERVEDD